MLGPNAVYYFTWFKKLVVVMIQETEGLCFEYSSSFIIATSNKTSKMSVNKPIMHT